MQNLFSKMIQRIDEDYTNLKQYTENMAHEFQTPLTVIRNKLENLLGEKTVMQKGGKDIKIIYDETNYLSNLGQTLNLLTKIENREFSDNRELFTNLIIENHLEAISETIQAKKLKIDTHLSPEHVLHLDPVLLDIILKNLIRNAIQYAHKSGPLIIYTEPGKFSISNFGDPLPFPEEKLFTRFQHSNDSQKSLGLGLAIIKKICDLNNLSIGYVYKDKMHVFSIEKQHDD
jgi:two-component system OmpR family sensor kinase